MPKQSAKDYVKSRFPNARAEKQVQGRVTGFQKTYWLIRDGNATMYMASGDTEPKAWKNAKEFIDEKSNG